ncbi:MAG: sodium:solute symporter [Planctomycetota bacterium]
MKRRLSRLTKPCITEEPGIYSPSSIVPVLLSRKNRPRFRGGAIHFLDLLIIILFLAGFAGYGLWQSRFNRSPEDYFLGRRSLPWPVAMFSIVATETSVLTFISVPGLAYREDWYFLQLALGYIVGRIGVSVFLLPAYFKSGVVSIYEVLGRRFGPAIQKTASAIFLITRVLADGVRFLATAVIVQAVTGWSLPLAVAVIGGVTVIYTLLGGIRTVVWVDSIQFVIYLLGAVVSIAFLLHLVPGSASESFALLREEGKLTIFHGGQDLFGDPTLAISAIIGGILLALASHGVDHMMVQRVLVCRNLRSARMAMVGSGIFAFLQFFAFLLVGSLLYLFYQGEAMAKDREFSSFIVGHLPVGVRGLLLAGVLSAAMSTLSSSINALASSTLMDWLKKRATLGLSRLVSMGWAILLVAIALCFDESDKAVVVLGLQIASFTYGGLLSLFLLGKMKSGFRPESLIAGLAGSLIVLLLLKQAGMAWTWFVAAGVLANLVITLGLERLRKLF